MTIEYQAIVLGPGEGKTISAMGVELIYKAVGAETGGQYFCMEYKAPANWFGPPKHIHSKTDEAFYILDGEITVHMGDQEIKGTPGSFVQIPRGAAHTFANTGATPAKYLIFAFPAGLEGFFEELPTLVEKYGYPPPPELMRELGRKYDFEPVGPPPGIDKR